MNNRLELIDNLKQEYQLGYAQIWCQFASNLRGESENKLRLMGQFYNEVENLPVLVETKSISSLCCLYLTKAILSYLFADYLQAITFMKKATQYESGIVGLFQFAQKYFYDSLALLAHYGNVSSQEQEEYLAQVTTNQQKLKNWSAHAPMNYFHKYVLVEAEKARVLGEYWQASEFYEQGIQGAKENEYLQEEALAYELAAKFYLERGRLKFAQTYMQEAHYAYTCWEAKAKVADLETKYPQLLKNSAQTSSINTIATIKTDSTSNSQSGNSLDLATIMRASQAIVTEIKLDKLLANLMRIMIQNAGAQTGLLILETEGEWFIEATGEVDTEKVSVLHSVPITNRVAASVVNYVINTQETVVEKDAAHEGNFTEDAYMQAKQTKSLLCAPLINQGKINGIVYLENNLTTGAFTRERLEVLQLLSRQAAIAIANAKLYAEVRENERQLRQFLEAMPVGVAIHNAKGEVEYLNQVAKELTKFEEIPEAKTEELPEVYGLRWAETKQLCPMAEMPVVRSLTGETVKVDNLELHQPNATVPLEISSTPIFDKKGEIKYAIAAFADITDRKQAQKILTDYNKTLENQVTERTRELKNTLHTLQKTQNELIQSEKMAALGQLIANIAHEINTPLGAIQASIGNIAHALDNSSQLLPQLLGKLSTPQQVNFFNLVAATAQKSSFLTSREERKLRRSYKKQLEKYKIEDANFVASQLVEMGFDQEIAPFVPLLQNLHSDLIINTAYNLAIQQTDCQNIQLAVERAAKIVFALKSYARQDQGGEKVRASVSAGIDVVLTIYYNQLKQGISIKKNYREVPEILCYPEQLNQVWTNLIQNALQAMDNQGRLEIDVTQQDQEIVVKITDSGSGIPQDIQKQIFQPFFTTKAAGEGSGLGLDIVSKIIAEHQGRIAVDSVPSKTTFTVYLPILS